MEISKIPGSRTAIDKPVSRDYTGNDEGEFEALLQDKMNEPRGEKKIIGLTTIAKPGTSISYGMTAAYADNSTKENPIVELTTNYDGKRQTIQVAINEINPKSASRMEMFALCSYMDGEGLISRSKFGSWSTLRAVDEMSVHNGFFNNVTEGCGDMEQFTEEKLDWERAGKLVADLLFECKAMKQYLETKNLLKVLESFDRNETAQKTEEV